MENDKFEVRTTPLFEADLNEILDYISLILLNPQAANTLLNKIEYSIEKRSFYPNSFEIYRSSKTRLHPYYRIIVDNYCIFYVVIENVMELRRILYIKRDFRSKI